MCGHYLVANKQISWLLDVKITLHTYFLTLTYITKYGMKFSIHRLDMYIHLTKYNYKRYRYRYCRY